MFDKRKVIDIAESYVGYTEKASNAQLDDPTANAGHNNWNRFAAMLDKIKGFYNGPKNIGPQGLWCDIFVDACFVEAYGVDAAKKLLCQPDYSAGAGCGCSAMYFQNHGQFFRSGPQTGDQIFFSYKAGEVSHTGLVVAVSATTVTTVEGNSSDAVQKKTYSISDSRIYGYGRPDWDGSVAVDVPQEAVKKPYKYHMTQYPVTLALLRRGDYGPQVVDMQAMLDAKGWPCDADGEFGSETEKALKRFQRAVGLIDDGEYGGQSMNALMNY